MLIAGLTLPRLSESSTPSGLVAGDGAENAGKQTGGWTITWQGTGNVPPRSQDQLDEAARLDREEVARDASNLKGRRFKIRF